MRTSLPRPRLFALFTISTLVLHLTIASAQVPCTGPDGLSPGPCCQIVGPNLPAFSGVQIPGLGICWSNCQPQASTNLIVDWPTPAWIQCSEYVTQMTVTDANTAMPILNGTLNLSYTRSWEEIDPAGNLHQVWRFAAKADLAPIPFGAIPPCPSPRCLPPFGNQPTAFFYGYVDYATDCGLSPPLTQNAVVLYHACDFFIHRPNLSSRPGSFHPNESYAIVAPHSSAQPFLVSLNPSPSGPMIGEATREFSSLPGGACISADRIATGQVGLLGGACLCPPGPVPKQHRFRTFQGQLSCPDAAGLQGNFQALNLAFPNVLPWFYLTTTDIGCWTNGNAYPGKECAWVDEGLFIQQQACSASWVSVQYGGTTKDGWMINHPVFFSGFTDLADNWTAPLFGPYNFPILGSIQPTDRVLYVNTP